MCIRDRVHSPERNFYSKAAFLEAFGGFAAGDEISLNTQEALRVIPGACSTLMRFEDGTPALVQNQLGHGTAFFACASFEDGLLMEQQNKNFLQSPVFCLYRAIAEAARALPECYTDALFVETGCLKGPDHTMVISVNHADAPVETQLHLPAWAKAVRVYGGDQITPVEGAIPCRLDPCGVAIFLLEA